MQNLQKYIYKRKLKYLTMSYDWLHYRLAARWLLIWRMYRHTHTHIIYKINMFSWQLGGAKTHIVPAFVIIVGLPEVRSNMLRLVKELELPVACVRVQHLDSGLWCCLPAFCEVSQRGIPGVVRSQRDVHTTSVPFVDAGVFPVLLDSPFADVHHCGRKWKRYSPNADLFAVRQPGLGQLRFLFHFFTSL